MLSTVLIASIAVVVVVVENRARKAFNEPVHPPNQARVVPTDPERKLFVSGRASQDEQPGGCGSSVAILPVPWYCGGLLGMTGVWKTVGTRSPRLSC